MDIKIIPPETDRFPVIDQALEIATLLPIEHPARSAILIDAAYQWTRLCNPAVLAIPEAAS